jgi:hypothetical protein
MGMSAELGCRLKFGLNSCRKTLLGEKDLSEALAVCIGLLAPMRALHVWSSHRTIAKLELGSVWEAEQNLVFRRQNSTKGKDPISKPCPVSKGFRMLVRFCSCMIVCNCMRSGNKLSSTLKSLGEFPTVSQC